MLSLHGAWGRGLLTGGCSRPRPTRANRRLHALCKRNRTRLDTGEWFFRK